MRIEFKEIEDFIKLANKFRLTPVVDDDFPQIRDEFDNERIRLTQKIDDVKSWQEHQADLDRREKAGEFGKW